MGFDLAKHGLNLKMGFKTKFGLILGKQKKTVEEKRRGEDEKAEEEEEEKKKMKERSSSKAKKVWKLTLSMELCIDLYGYMFVGCGL